jgi:hypothetical protein
VGKPRNVYIACSMRCRECKWFGSLYAFLIFCVQMLEVKNNLQELGVPVLGYCSHTVPVTLGYY